MFYNVHTLLVSAFAIFGSAMAAYVSPFEVRELSALCDAALTDDVVNTNCCTEFTACYTDTDCNSCVTSVSALTDEEKCTIVDAATSFDDLTMDFCGVDEPLFTTYIECVSMYKYDVSGTDTMAYMEYQEAACPTAVDDAIDDDDAANAFCDSVLMDDAVNMYCCTEFNSCFDDADCQTCALSASGLTDAQKCDMIDAATSFDDLTMDFCDADIPLFTDFLECVSMYKYDVMGNDTMAYMEYQEAACPDGAASYAFGGVLIIGLISVIIGQ